jgi:predicted house-cleaning NTP pyrophosphatase (Maf/HAM1 superfamily)
MRERISRARETLDRNPRRTFLPGEDQAGTVVVIAQTKRRVIIAADSRAATTKNGTVVEGINDCYCKIAALSGGVVFTAAGLLSDDNQTWTAVTEAAVAIANTPHSSRISSMESDSVLSLWAESMKRNFLEFSRDQLSAYADTNDGVSKTGVALAIQGPSKAELT